jgi:hypothetical protein
LNFLSSRKKTARTITGTGLSTFREKTEVLPPMKIQDLLMYNTRKTGPIRDEAVRNSIPAV